MYAHKGFAGIVLAGAVALLTGCAGTAPGHYAELPAAAQMQPNVEGNSDRIPYSYSARVNWRDYRAIIIEPVVVYRGADNQFDGLPEKDKLALAQFMQGEFQSRLGRRFRLARAAEPGTLQLRLTLTGAKPNTAVVSTVTRFDLVGGPVNIVQSLRGKEGLFLGAVMYAVELRDARDGRLLKAYVAKQYPNAMNIGATLGRLSAAKIGIEKGAEELVQQLQ